MSNEREELGLKSLKKSTNLYAEIYEDDQELEDLTEMTVQEWPETSKCSEPKTSLERVRGMLKPAPGEPMPTDADLADDYTDYLMEKFA